MSIKTYTERDLAELLDESGLPPGKLDVMCKTPCPDFPRGFVIRQRLESPLALDELLDGYGEQIYWVMRNFGAYAPDNVVDSSRIHSRRLMDILHLFHGDGTFQEFKEADGEAQDPLQFQGSLDLLEPWAEDLDDGMDDDLEEGRGMRPWVATCLSLDPEAVNLDPTQLVPLSCFQESFERNRSSGIPKALQRKNPDKLLRHMQELYEISNTRQMRNLERIQREVYVNSDVKLSYPWARFRSSFLMFLAEASQYAKRVAHGRLFTNKFRMPTGYKPRLKGRFLSAQDFPQVLKHREED